MEQNRRAQFFQRLDANIQETEVETNLVPPHDDMGETLRALLPVTDEGDPTLLEIMVAPYAEEADLLLFYFTMIAKIDTGYEELLGVLPQWNLEVPLGAFGIFDNQEEELSQLFFKYSILVDPEIDPEELADIAMFHMIALYEIVSQQYPEAYRITKGEELPQHEEV